MTCGIGGNSGSGGPVLITGGAGFIGANLADRLAREGHDVILFDALLRPGVERNLDWLHQRHGARIRPIRADVRDAPAVEQAVQAAAVVFHFAAQVAVTTSLRDPQSDFDVNMLGTFNVLEAARRAKTPPPIIFASTNKVYGDLADLAFTTSAEGHLPEDGAIRRKGISERRPLDFHTPYGCSKGAADQYVLDYARSFGVPTAVLRMSCIYGERQMGTEDQGWVAHFLIRAIENRPITLYGDGYQVRDILEVGDAVEAYVRTWRRIDEVAGSAFNLGGGPDNAVCLRQLIGQIGTLMARDVDVRLEDWRKGDQRYFVADTAAVRAALDLPPPLGWKEGLARLARWLAQERGVTIPDRQPVAWPATGAAQAVGL